MNGKLSLLAVFRLQAQGPEIAFSGGPGRVNQIGMYFNGYGSLPLICMTSSPFGLGVWNGLICALRKEQVKFLRD